MKFAAPLLADLPAEPEPAVSSSPIGPYRILGALGAALRVSEGGGREPRWAPSGRELFYRSEAGMVAAAVGTASAITVGRREVLFDVKPYLAISNGAGYDVHPDGRRFMMIRRGPESHEVVVVLNWFDQLRAGRR